METKPDTKSPVKTRHDFAARYSISERTFLRWVYKYQLYEVVPDIIHKKVFTPNEFQLIINILG